MSTSPHEKSQVEKWVEAKSRIRASFFGLGGICMVVDGRLRISPDKEKLWLLDDADVLVLVMPFASAALCERVEPLIDLPEELRWKVDFLVAESFELKSGHLDLLEVGEPEIDT